MGREGRQVPLGRGRVGAAHRDEPEADAREEGQVRRGALERQDALARALGEVEVLVAVG
jgi:hypothetical protein